MHKITKVKETYKVINGDEMCIVEYYPESGKFESIKTRLLPLSKLVEHSIACIKQNKEIEENILNYLTGKD